MKNLTRIAVYLLLIIFVSSCAGSRPASEKTAKAKPEPKDYSNFTNMYDVLSSVGGITMKRAAHGIEVSIRGSQSATNTNEPLFVLNGVPVGRTFGSIEHIPPVRIKRITVQRGLASTNRWGSEGNSGAILITTKEQEN